MERGGDGDGRNFIGDKIVGHLDGLYGEQARCAVGQADFCRAGIEDDGGNRPGADGLAVLGGGFVGIVRAGFRQHFVDERVAGMDRAEVLAICMDVDDGERVAVEVVFRELLGVARSEACSIHRRGVTGGARGVEPCGVGDADILGEKGGTEGSKADCAEEFEHEIEGRGLWRCGDA